MNKMKCSPFRNLKIYKINLLVQNLVIFEKFSTSQIFLVYFLPGFHPIQEILSAIYQRECSVILFFFKS